MRWTLWALVSACLLASQVAAYTRDADGTEHFSREDLAAMLPEEQRRDLRAALIAARMRTDAERAFTRRWSPTKTYAPAKVPCPALPGGDNYVGYIRNASNDAIGPQEQDYLKRHRAATADGWKAWLKQAGLDGNGGLPGGVDQYVSNGNQPKVGIAISGGGYRAMLHGVGVVQGLDGRNKTATDRKVGGFFQLVDYVAGLSGGSWATGSMALNNWPTTQELLQQVFDLESNLVLPEDGKTKLYVDLFRDVDDKKDAGYPTAITDFWGRALSYHLVNQSAYPNQGQATTFSDIVNVTRFQDASYPFPVVLAIGRDPNELMVNPNATYFEFTPYEFGSWQPTMQAFMPVGYLGSQLKGGQVASGDKTCVSGYENFGFVVGSSSTLFNAAYLKMLQSNSTSITAGIVKSILSDLDLQSNDIAGVPNPFINYRPDTNEFNTQEYIDLVDGGEANQNIPLEPLYQSARGLDMVMAVDGSGDVTNWPNGSGIVETRKRMNLTEFKSQKFVEVPDINTIVNQGLNTRPSFFGCSNSSDANQAPLLVYMPSYPYSYWSNTSTFQLEYNTSDAQQFVDNSVDVATMKGEMADWPECLACASLQRGMQRSKTTFPDKCKQCFLRYCWNGEYNTTQPGNYTPAIGLPDFVTSNGTKLVEPKVTGANESSQGLGDIFGERGPPSSAAGLVAYTPYAVTMVMAAVATALL